MTGESAPEPGAASIEVELAFDVADDAALPEWGGLPGVASVGPAEPRDLDAVYFDTAALDLAHARAALRRRSGGHDAGWHLKTTLAEGRAEHAWPLDDAPDPLEATVPEAVRRAVETWFANETGSTDASALGTLTPLARVRNARTAYALLGPDGGLVAEVADDRVRAEDLRRGVSQAWREWEFELGPAAPGPGEAREELMREASALVDRAGGRPSAAGSKLQRALQAP